MLSKNLPNLLQDKPQGERKRHEVSILFNLHSLMLAVHFKFSKIKTSKKKKREVCLCLKLCGCVWGGLSKVYLHVFPLCDNSDVCLSYLCYNFEAITAIFLNKRKSQQKCLSSFQKCFPCKIGLFHDVLLCKMPKRQFHPKMKML